MIDFLTSPVPVPFWMWLIVSGLALCEAMGLVFRR